MSKKKIDVLGYATIGVSAIPYLLYLIYNLIFGSHADGSMGVLFMALASTFLGFALVSTGFVLKYKAMPIVAFSILIPVCVFGAFICLTLPGFLFFLSVVALLGFIALDIVTIVFVSKAEHDGNLNSKECTTKILAVVIAYVLMLSWTIVRGYIIGDKYETTPSIAESSTISGDESVSIDISGVWVMSSNCGKYADTAFELKDMGDDSYMGIADFDVRPNSLPLGIRIYRETVDTFTGSFYYSDGSGNTCDEVCAVGIIDDSHIAIACSQFSGTAVKVK